jgi:hypothetical protein
MHSAVYRSTAHISGVTGFDSAASEVMLGRCGQAFNCAPIVPIEQQESSFLGPAIAPNLACVGGSWEAISERSKGGPGSRQGARRAPGHTWDPAGAVQRMLAARRAQAAQFAANVLPIIRYVKRPSPAISKRTKAALAAAKTRNAIGCALTRRAVDSFRRGCGTGCDRERKIACTVVRY